MKIILTILLVLTFSVTAVRAQEVNVIQLDAAELRKAEVRYLRMMRSRQRRVERLQRQARGRMQLQRMIYAQYMPPPQMIPYVQFYVVRRPYRSYYYPRYYYYRY